MGASDTFMIFIFHRSRADLIRQISQRLRSLAAYCPIAPRTTQVLPDSEDYFPESSLTVTIFRPRLTGRGWGQAARLQFITVHRFRHGK
jgi:hypothetical protein